MKLRGIVAAFVAVMFALQSCSSMGGQVRTASTAQPVGLQDPPVSNALLATPVAGENDLAVPPQAKVKVMTTCNAGPSTSYAVIFSVNPGPAVPIVGKDTADNYWVVNNPTGGTCWLSGKFAIVKGDTSTLPEVPPPPTPSARPGRTTIPPATPTSAGSMASSASAPSDPSALNGAQTCASGLNGQTLAWVEDITLTWQDNAVNESGFHVFQNNQQLTALPQDSTRYHLQLRYDQGTGSIAVDNFAVEAFNDSGTSTRLSVNMPRCH
jgi:hypothetical protein